MKNSKKQFMVVALAVAIFAAQLLLAARPAQAQTEAVLYNLTSSLTGKLTFDAQGNLYGATEGGGLGYGSVFELSPNGAGGWTETDLYDLTHLRGRAGWFCGPGRGCS